eukprot:3558345-Amphidinium_carterae.1
MALAGDKKEGSAVPVDTLQQADPWAKFKSGGPETETKPIERPEVDPSKFESLSLLTKVFLDDGSELPFRPLHEVLKEDKPSVTLVHHWHLKEMLGRLETHTGPCVFITQKGHGRVTGSD